MKNPNIETVEINVKDMKKLDDNTKRAVFIALQKHTTLELSEKWGFAEKHGSIKKGAAIIYYIFKQVRDNPKHFGLEPEVVNATVEIMKNRSMAMSPSKPIQEQLDVRELEDFARVKLGKVRDKLITIIEKKVDRALLNKKALAEISLRDAVSAMATILDKTRLMAGEATERIVHFSKISKDMSPEERLQLILESREAFVEENKQK